MPVTQHPLHRSVAAGLPHTAAALSRDDQALARLRVADANGRQPVSNDLVHAPPTHMFGLTAAAQRALPQPAYLASEGLHACPVAGHGEVACRPRHHRAQGLPLLGDGPVQPRSQRRLDRQHLGAHALGAGESQHHELAVSGLAAADVPQVRQAASPAVQPPRAGSDRHRPGTETRQPHRRHTAPRSRRLGRGECS